MHTYDLEELKKSLTDIMTEIFRADQARDLYVFSKTLEAALSEDGDSTELKELERQFGILLGAPSNGISTLQDLASPFLEEDGSLNRNSYDDFYNAIKEYQHQKDFNVEEKHKVWLGMLSGNDQADFQRGLTCKNIAVYDQGWSVPENNDLNINSLKDNWPTINDSRITPQSLLATPCSKIHNAFLKTYDDSDAHLRVLGKLNKCGTYFLDKAHHKLHSVLIVAPETSEDFTINLSDHNPPQLKLESNSNAQNYHFNDFDSYYSKLKELYPGTSVVTLDLNSYEVVSEFNDDQFMESYFLSKNAKKELGDIEKNYHKMWQNMTLLDYAVIAPLITRLLASIGFLIRYIIAASMTVVCLRNSKIHLYLCTFTQFFAGLFQSLYATELALSSQGLASLGTSHTDPIMAFDDLMRRPSHMTKPYEIDSPETVLKNN